MKEKSLRYSDAGVDIDKANQLVKHIQDIAATTRRPGVLSSIGGFGALFEIPTHRIQRPVLVSSTDGVGTKLQLATLLNHHEDIGIDLVAMCVNDIICHGAEPLFFLDYYATGQLDQEHARTIVQSISRGCQMANTALIGGETAEMPGLYHQDDYDLAGFCVGIVDKEKIIDGSRVQVGDRLIAIASSGIHANGFSLVRHIIKERNLDLNQPFGESTLGKILLTPTRIYVRTVQALLKSIDIRTIAHITGGGLIENIPRVLPRYMQACINTNSWQHPAIFQWLHELGHLDTEEMYRTFNMGVGLVIGVAAANVNTALDIIQATGEKAWVIGEVALNEHSESKVILQAK